MKPRFRVRSLLRFHLFCAVVLVLLCADHWLPTYWPYNTTCESICDDIRLLHYKGGILFWMVLLAPYWFFEFFFASEDRERNRVRPGLALIPVGWYYVLILWAGSWPVTYSMPEWCMKLIVCLGTIAACWILLLPRCRLWYAVVTPLGFAIVSGTIWLVVDR